MGVPQTVEELEPAWLGEQLGVGGDVTVTAATPLAAGTAFSTIMHRLELSGPDGTPASLVMKVPTDSDIRQLLDGIGAYTRELTFYGELAGEVPVRVPRPYVVAMDEDSTNFVLMLEDLSGLDPADQLAGLTMAQAETAIDALAAFHAWSWEHPRLAGLADRFPPLDGERAAAVYANFAHFFALCWEGARDLPVLADETRAIGERWAELLPFFVSQLSEPRTISHGELRADNLFLLPDGELLMIDFQTVAQQAGIIDVAYLVAGSLPIDVRCGHDEALVRRYVERLGVPGYGFERAWDQYRIALAFNLLLSVLAFSQYELTDDRGRQLLVEMLARSSDAIVATGALALLPD